VEPEQVIDLVVREWLGPIQCGPEDGLQDLELLGTLMKSERAPRLVFAHGCSVPASTGSGAAVAGRTTMLCLLARLRLQRRHGVCAFPSPEGGRGRRGRCRGGCGRTANMPHRAQRAHNGAVRSCR